ncbi:MAG: ATP-binding cassette domain-containing protein [Deltaproteobacteria bacterium]|nr:ATP-binding cassette domain-containing protein [Deltaproteobacteria bacterium]
MIEAKSLTMYYGSTRAVEDAGFRVEKGEILGLLGPNGAGKTTIMNILTTQIVPTSGSATIEGFDVLEQPIEVRRCTGYLPETVPLYVDMEVVEYLRFVAQGRGLAGPELENRLEWVVEKCGIRTMMRRLISQLSKGYRQRVGLAQALIHDPKVLVLDEPTSGLDPLQIIGIRDLVKELAKDKTIIVSTHILQEVEAISDRIIIINEGRIIADGTQQELQQAASQTPGRMVALKGNSADIERVLKGLPGVKQVLPVAVSQDDGVCSFRIQAEQGREIWPELAGAIQENGWLVKENRELKPSLEAAFIHLTRRELGQS